MNGIQVTNFHNRSTEPLNKNRIYSRPQASKTTRVLGINEVNELF